MKYIGIICFVRRIIRREAPRCSFYCEGYMPQPRFVGRVTDTDSHALFYVLMPNTVIEIGNYAFTEFDVIDSINIPNSVISIGNGAFLDCRSLKSVNIPSGLVDCRT